MEASGLAAIGTYVMRNKQQLGCIRAKDGILLLSQLYFADEIRPSKGLAPKGVRVSTQELEMAGELIDRYTGSFEIGKYRDSYRESLLRLIKAKQKGRGVHDEPADSGDKEEPPSDLLEALRESVAQHAGKGSAAAKRNSRGSMIADLTKSELVLRAKREKVKSYSTMNKDELIAALS